MSWQALLCFTEWHQKTFHNDIPQSLFSECTWDGPKIAFYDMCCDLFRKCSQCSGRWVFTRDTQVLFLKCPPDGSGEQISRRTHFCSSRDSHDMATEKTFIETRDGVVFLKAHDGGSGNFSRDALWRYSQNAHQVAAENKFFCSRTPECYYQNFYEMATENSFSLLAVLCYSQV